jgi:hypothetical protein
MIGLVTLSGAGGSPPPPTPDTDAVASLGAGWPNLVFQYSATMNAATAAVTFGQIAVMA